MSHLLNTYFDNASTTYPKPEAVKTYITKYLDKGGNYGRAATQRAFDNSQIVEQCRDEIAALLGTHQSDSIFFVSGATLAANMVLHGIHFSKGDVILLSPMEHHAVSRPAHHIAQTKGGHLLTMPALPSGVVDVEALQKMNLAGVKLATVCHVSNVNGVEQPIGEIKKILGNIPLLVDASQSIGRIPVTADRWQADYVIFTGHKALYGATGAGGLFVRNPETLLSYCQGGTGSNSDSLTMPETLPDRFQAGTPNLIGLYGLLGGIRHRPQPQHTAEHYHQVLDEVRQLNNLTLYREEGLTGTCELFSITHTTLSPSDLAMNLYEQFQIEVRAGLHCASTAHKTLKTIQTGTCRISLSCYHTPEDLSYLVDALKQLCH